MNKINPKDESVKSMDEEIKVGRRIQRKRKEKGYTAAQLSEKIGVSQQQLSRYERGENRMSLAHLVCIAAILETPISWFFIDCDKTIQILSSLQEPKDESHIVSAKTIKTELDDIWAKLPLDKQVSLLQFLRSVYN